MIVALCLLAAVVSLLAHCCRKYSRQLQLAGAFPGPRGYPIIGNGHLMINKRPEVFVTIVADLIKKYGELFRIWIGPELIVFLMNVQDYELVLGGTSFNQKAEQYQLMKSWLNEGLLISFGKKWSDRRKIITPAFHFKSLEQFVEIFDKQARVFVANLRRHVGEDQVDVFKYVSLFTLDTICETAMGVSVNCQTNADSDYVKAVKTMGTVIHKRMFNVIHRYDITYTFTHLAREEKKSLAILHGFTEKIIKRRREEILRAKAEKEIHDDHATKKKKMAFLDILLQSEIDGKPLSDLDIREEVDTFVLEGHDTMASALLFFIYNMATHPVCQQKCFDEIRSVLGPGKGARISHDDLTKLQYVEMCIKESLRMYPPVPLLGRKVVKECELNGKLIPAGTSIALSPFHMGRSEKYFPNASEYRPERFASSNNERQMPTFAYIPFSAGPRNCIGQKFAMLEIKTFVINLLRNFEIEFRGDEEPILVMEMVLKSRDPLLFRLKERKY